MHQVTSLSLTPASFWNNEISISSGAAGKLQHRHTMQMVTAPGAFEASIILALYQFGAG
jgi:hypothetical protein